MHHEKPLPIQCEHSRCREVGEVAPLIRRELRDRKRACHGREIAEPACTPHFDILRDSMVVIPPDTVRRIPLNPVDAWPGFGTIVHDIAKTETNIERLPDGFQCRAVSVDVRYDEDTHLRGGVGVVGMRSLERQKGAEAPWLSNVRLAITPDYQARKPSDRSGPATSEQLARFATR